jgi:hypothetical protein
MAGVTLQNLFEGLDGRYFPSRQELEHAVLEIFNRHVAELPVGYSYTDAIEGARSLGWLRTNGDGHGVTVELHAQPAAAG